MKEISPKRILVPVSGNPTDDEMVALACTIAQRTKGEVQVIYIIEVKRTLPLDADLPPEAEKGEMVLEQAERVADLIMLGIPYKRRYGEFDLGQPVPFVLKPAHCRVWVSRQPMD